MEIVDYSRDTMGEDVSRLFCEIYPGWSSEDVQRVLYDERSPLHVATKVAIMDTRFVGQANVFLLPQEKTIANIGIDDNERNAVTAASKLLKEQFPVKNIVLFGSKARGDDDEESDIDLLVLLERKITW